MSEAPVRILFICTGNAARSQMAEGFTRAWAADHVWVESAGIRPFGLSQTAVRVMAEVGIDISRHQSKGLDQVAASPDFVITLCNHAAQTCPTIHATRQKLHWPTLDPGGPDGPADPLERYRQIRASLADRVRTFLTDHDWLNKER